MAAAAIDCAHLPSDLLHLVLERLPRRDHCACRLVCRRWHAAVSLSLQHIEAVYSPKAATHPVTSSGSPGTAGPNAALQPTAKAAHTCATRAALSTSDSSASSASVSNETTTPALACSANATPTAMLARFLSLRSVTLRLPHSDPRLPPLGEVPALQQLDVRCPSPSFYCTPHLCLSPLFPLHSLYSLNLERCRIDARDLRRLRTLTHLSLRRCVVQAVPEHHQGSSREEDVVYCSWSVTSSPARGSGPRGRPSAGLTLGDLATDHALQEGVADASVEGSCQADMHGGALVLSALVNLRSLSLSSCRGITLDGTAVGAHITRIMLRCDSADLAAGWAAGLCMTQLQHLTVECQERDGTSALCQNGAELTRLQALSHLSLQLPTLNTSVFTALAHLTCLTHVQLGLNAQDAHLSAPLPPTCNADLAHLHSLTRLHHLGPSLRSISCEDIARLTACLPALRSLSFAGCHQLQDDACWRIAAAAGQLTALDLSFCQNVTDVGLHVMALSLPSLRELRLDGCFTRLTDKGIKKLANLKQLRSLSLAYCDRISDRAVISVMREACKLTYLSLRDCDGITNKTLSAVPSCLPDLRILDVSCCSRASNTQLNSLRTGVSRSTPMETDESRPRASQQHWWSAGGSGCGEDLGSTSGVQDSSVEVLNDADIAQC